MAFSSDNNKRLKLAEKAAESEFQSSDADLNDEDELGFSDDLLDKSTDLKKTTKKRHRRVLSIQKSRKLSHQEKQNECKVKQLLKQYLGGSDVVKETNYGARRGFTNVQNVVVVLLKISLVGT